MRRLVPCPQCKRHFFSSDAACPHCGKTTGAVALAALTMTAGLALAACDGATPGPSPAAVYGPPAVLPDDRGGQPVPTASATAAPSALSTAAASAAASSSAAAPTSTAATPPPTAVPVYGPPPVKPDDRKPKQ